MRNSLEALYDLNGKGNVYKEGGVKACIRGTSPVTGYELVASIREAIDQRDALDRAITNMYRILEGEK